MEFSLKKILVAEDDKSLSHSIDTWLTLEGFQVESVFNGEEALHKILHDNYDLLITDIAMPRLNGIDLISQTRHINPNLPIMVVSGKLSPELIANLHSMAVQHVLSKPIKPVQFRKKIEELFPNQVYL